MDGTPEFKSLEFTNIKAAASGRVRAGVAAVFGNIDAVGDRIMPGAFAKTIAEGAKRTRFLWNHSYQHPPVASIKELRELSRSELPQEVLDKAPEATGGLLVKREYYKDVDLANWILAGVDAGDVNEMSFAYDTIQSSTVVEPIDGDSEKTREVRELRELKLYDCSDVLWGCNAATVAAGAKNLGLLPLGVIASQLAMVEAELKAGARNATADQKLIELIHATIVSLGAKCAPEDTDDATGKLGNPAEILITKEGQAEAAVIGSETSTAISTSLANLKLQTAKLQIQRFRLEI